MSAGFAVLALLAALMISSPASAADTAGGKVDTATSRPAKVSSATFAAEGRAAGLTAGQASALQGAVNLYLAKYGTAARQTSFNTVALKGADIHVAVPGEAHPRGIAGTYCAYKWFCAYQYEYQNGDDIHMYDCGAVNVIPWSTTGSWVNNQTRGTQPLLTFTNGSTWRMPGAYAQQLSGVGWGPVWKIVPC
jgi:hypothetical protein